MKAPTLTVIVPTRERSDTLFHTLRTLVDQDYDDCEIIISDNYSQDGTRQVVESFSDPRVHYINTGQRISMSENWEFALRHARGHFITYLGDDDGFIPGALKGAMSILEESKFNALVWEKAEYCWPDYIESSMRNWFSLKNKTYSLFKINGRSKLSQVIKFRDSYTKLPCLYNGIVKKSLLDEIRSLTTNNIFFNSISPDVFSGIVLSMFVENYLYTDYSFSVNGASRHSNGTSFMRQKASSPDNPHSKFIAENQRKYDERLLMGPAIPICVMGEYLLAKQFLHKIDFPNVSWKSYTKALIKNAKYAFMPKDVLQSAAYTVKKVGLKVKVPENIVTIKSATEPNIGAVGDSFCFIVPHGMVKNIYDACQLVAGMLPNIANLKQYSSIKYFFVQSNNFLIITLKNLYRLT